MGRTYTAADECARTSAHAACQRALERLAGAILASTVHAWCHEAMTATNTKRAAQRWRCAGASGRDSSTAVERFMASVGLSSARIDRASELPSAPGLRLRRPVPSIAADSGRWVKLTEESAQAVKQFGLTPTKTPGVSHAMVGQPGDIKQWIQIVKSPGSMVTNPAMLAGAAGIMAQIAMQQQMDAITDYLAIDRREARRRAPCSDEPGARAPGRRRRSTVREAMSVRECRGSGLGGHLVEGAELGSDDS